MDGKLYSGFNGTAGEIGHMVIAVGGPKCNCGNRGCFEALASRGAIFRSIYDAIKDGQKTLLTDMLGPDLTDLRSGDLRKAIRKGDKLVEKIVEDAAEYTGIAVANLINIFNPQMVVLGGGVIDALGDEMMAIIVETAEDYAMSGTCKDIEIVASKAGDDAGIIGGAVLARRAANKQIVQMERTDFEPQHPDRRAVIDVGTNSVKLLVGDVAGDVAYSGLGDQQADSLGRRVLCNAEIAEPRPLPRRRKR